MNHISPSSAKIEREKSFILCVDNLNVIKRAALIFVWIMPLNFINKEYKLQKQLKTERMRNVMVHFEKVLFHITSSSLGSLSLDDGNEDDDVLKQCT